MKNKIARIRAHVSTNRTYYAFLSGSLITSATVIALKGDTTLLKLTKEHAQMLKEGGAVVYELKDQTLHLVNIPAAEAANAAASTVTP